MKAWYFSDVNRRLRFEDGRIIKAGRTHKVIGELKMCEYGLHASKDIISALAYAPGPYVWRVELGGDVIYDEDKLCARERKYIWGYDATEILRKFARMCALDVIDVWDAPPVVVKYLRTGDETLMAVAKDAAWAARDAAMAARDAAWAAMAAMDAAWAARAAMGTTWAARAAAMAARDAARAVGAKQNTRITRMIMRGKK